MTLIEGIGDEVIHFFIGLIVVLVASVAWWTTSISEQRHVQTVLLLDGRRHRAHRRLTSHTQAVTIAEGSQSASAPPETEVASPVPAPKPPDRASTSAGAEVEEEEDDERVRIVETMDDEASMVRQRRIAFYERGEEMSPVMEHNYAEAAHVPRTESDITIKLKYINDDLKLVDGKLQEQLGDFKKRHFHGELSSNKLVRLIFNGQVLQPDSKTLGGCGLFDNCVVHCLIHTQRRPVPGEEVSSGASQSTSSLNRPNNQNNNNQGRDWDLGNFLFAIISFTLLSAWYFRYVYAHLYTVTATVGLVLMTGVFTIVLFGFYFPDHEHIPRAETTQTAQT